MAKDDNDVIVYCILVYLYGCLKRKIIYEDVTFELNDRAKMEGSITIANCSLDTLLDTLSEGRHSFLDISTFLDLLTNSNPPPATKAIARLSEILRVFYFAQKSHFWSIFHVSSKHFPAVILSSDFDFSDRPRNIADPWYTGVFDTTYEDIEEGLRAFLKYLGYAC